MAETNETPPLAQWKAGAIALHKFQQAAYAAGKTSKGQHGLFSSLKDIIKTIKDASDGTGLSHAETWRALGTDYAVLRVTLHHESGEQIWSELPVDITQKNRSGSREQAQGSAMTYARRYLLLGIYGLANDDEDDDGAATTSIQTQQKAPKKAEKSAPVTVTVEKSEQEQSEVLTKDQIDLCIGIVKQNPDIKAAFMKKFYPSAEKLFPNMLKTKEHLEFLDAESSKIPF